MPSIRPSFLMSIWDQLARVLALVAADRFDRLQRFQAIETEAAQDARDGRL
jgi:hypothetical protein